MKRRQLLAAGLGAPLATLAAPAVVRAEGKYPDHIVRLVVPFAPAGPTDIIGRKTAEKMTALLGQTMIVDNKAGAAGSIGAVEVKNAKPDGYTLIDRSRRCQERQARRLHVPVRHVFDARHQSDGLRQAAL